MTAFRVLGISWIGLGTDRYEETLSLFRDLMGLDVLASVPNQAILQTPGGQQVELFGRAGPGKTMNSPPAFAFEVDDFDAARSALAGHGLELLGAPGSWDNHRWQYFRTPDGYVMSIKTTTEGQQ